MIKIIEIIRKNFKLLVRAKVSALVIFVGPLLLVSLLGLAYSQSNTFTFSAGVYSEGYTALSESLITKMGNQNFRIIKADSSDNCINSLKRGETQACIIFPPGMTIDNPDGNEITFYVDYSQINLVWLILDVMSASVSETSDEISKDLTSDLLKRIWFVESKLRLGQTNLDDIENKGSKVNESFSKINTEIKKLDISVDFGNFDVNSEQKRTQNISAILEDINSKAGEMAKKTESAISNIESSVGSVASDVNDSDIEEELDVISDAASKIEEAVNSLMSNVDSDVKDASKQVDLIKKSFKAMNEKIGVANNKISNAKKQRDSLFPELDNASLEIEKMSDTISTGQANIDEALQKLLAVKGKNAEGISSPIRTKIEPISTQKTHFNSLFPTLLALMILITGVLLSSTLVLVEKKSRAFFRNHLTPTSYFTFSIATYLTALIVLLIQLLLFVSVGAFFFETKVFTSLLLILLLVFIAATVFICIGMFIGFIFRTEETANLASITLIATFLLFSSAVIPLESLPAYMKTIADFSPFVVSEVAFRQAIIFEMGFSKMTGTIILLSAYAVLIFASLIALQSILRRLAFVQFSNKHSEPRIVKEKKGSTKISNETDNVKHDINELAVNKDEGKTEVKEERIESASAQPEKN